MYLKCLSDTTTLLPADICCQVSSVGGGRGFKSRPYLKITGETMLLSWAISIQLRCPLPWAGSFGTCLCFTHFHSLCIGNMKNGLQMLVRKAEDSPVKWYCSNQMRPTFSAHHFCVIPPICSIINLRQFSLSLPKFCKVYLLPFRVEIYTKPFAFDGFC